MKDFGSDQWLACRRCIIIHELADRTMSIDFSGPGLKIGVAPTLCDCACHLHPVKKVPLRMVKP